MLRGKQIVPMLRQIIDYNLHFDKMLHKGVNRHVLEVFVRGKLENGFADHQDFEALVEKMRKVEERAEYQVLDDPPRILFTLGNHRARIDQQVLENLSSHEYSLLLKAFRQVEDICKGEKALISSEGQEERSVEDRQELRNNFV